MEEQYKEITRDHQTAVDFYNSLLKKMNDSSMATALEQRQQGEQFRVMERDIWAFTKLSTLAVISHIDGLPEPEKHRWRWNPFSRNDKPIESVVG